LPACLSFDLKLKPSPSTRHGFRRVLDLASPRARRACRSAAPGIKLHQLLLSEGVMRESRKSASIKSAFIVADISAR
jgi:hypothetical protein